MVHPVIHGVAYIQLPHPNRSEGLNIFTEHSQYDAQEINQTLNRSVALQLMTGWLYAV